MFIETLTKDSKVVTATTWGQETGKALLVAHDLETRVITESVLPYNDVLDHFARLSAAGWR
jgi:hypothetical protein